MQPKNNNKDSFNECFWAYVYLVVQDDSYLSQKGRIIKFIVQDGGCCESVSCIARRLGIQKPVASKILNDLQKEGCISLVKQGNKKLIKFDEDIITKALKIPYNILGEKDNEY
jgi:DNA-binding MarR family transcriptional regulator